MASLNNGVGRSILSMASILMCAGATLWCSGCSDRPRTYGYYESEGMIEEQSRRDSAPSAAPMAPSPDELVRPVPPTWSPRSPNVTNLGPTVNPATSDSKPVYLTNVRNQMGALFREMMQILANARTKGAPAQTAVSNPALDFARAQDQVEAGVTLAHKERGEDWEIWRDPIEDAMSEAKAAVLEAKLALAHAPSLPLTQP